MTKLICFYENDTFLVSECYQKYSCHRHKNPFLFLKEIEQLYPEQLKIVQINFEAFHQSLFQHQQKLYSSYPAEVFILEKYEIVSSKQILKPLQNKQKATTPFQTLVDRKTFIEQVTQIKSFISEGRIYQVNLTAPLCAQTDLEPEELFLKYSTDFHGQYKALLPLTELSLISFSPELFLYQKDGILMTQPIKGSQKTDSNNKTSDELLNNPKEAAELSMIVDLLRNDLNSLSSINSAQVNAHRKIMNLDYIQHTYSEIEIKNQKTLPEVIEKTFPGGSISGCPKLESLKVISEIEKFQRSAYTGCFGWWKKDSFKLSITIRSLYQTTNNLFYNAGCGIVFDSEPEQEWNELINKTGALRVDS